MIRSEIRTALVAAAGAALMSGVVACSSLASTTEQQTAAPLSASAQSRQVPGGHDAFMQCMTDNGVPAPPDGAAPPHNEGGPIGDHGTAPLGVDQQTWDNARQACASPAPEPPAKG
jgi:hypothetical protein